MSTVLLKVRETPSSPWHQVFSQNGWKVRDPSNSYWIQMTPQNTKLRSADNSTWLNVK
jgi:hypothetical protein